MGQGHLKCNPGSSVARAPPCRPKCSSNPCSFGSMMTKVVEKTSAPSWSRTIINTACLRNLVIQRLGCRRDQATRLAEQTDEAALVEEARRLALDAWTINLQDEAHERFD